MSEVLSNNYRPKEDEPFMNPVQLEYFKNKLVSWRDQLLKESTDTIVHLQADAQIEADIVDSAANETDRTIELRARDRKYV